MKQFKESNFHKTKLKIEEVILHLSKLCPFQTHLSTHPLHTQVSGGVEPGILLETRCCVLPMTTHSHRPSRSPGPTALCFTGELLPHRQFQEFFRNLLQLGSLFTSEVNFPFFPPHTHLMKLQQASWIHNTPHQPPTE